MHLVTLVLTAVAFLAPGALEPPLQFDVLAGKSSVAVAALLGVPGQGGALDSSRIADDIYQVGPGAVLAVTYCESKAVSFFLRLETGAASAEALALSVGLAPSSFRASVEDGFVVWAPGPSSSSPSGGSSQPGGPSGLVRAEAMLTLSGWSEIVADYQGC